jgi:sarcosine oxidase subunit beta
MASENLLTTADVAVVGGGIVGASIAWHLAQRGVTNVVIVERESHQGAGSTGRSMGGVRVQFGTEPNIRMSMYSIAHYREFERVVGEPSGYKPHGYLFVASSERHLAHLASNVAHQQSLGVDNVRLLAPAEVGELAPMVRLDDVVGGSFCPTDGFVDPYSVMNGYTSSALGKGVRMVKGAEVTRVLVEHGRVVGLETRKGRVSSPNVVVAAGAWVAPLAATAGVTIPVTPHRRMLLPTEPFPGIPERCPMVIDMATGFHFRPEGRGLLFAWSDPDEVPCREPVFDPAFVEKVLVHAVDRVPAFIDLAVNPKRGWGGLYEMSPDKHGILGPTPVEGLWCANGFSGHDARPWQPFALARFDAGELLHEPAVL